MIHIVTSANQSLYDNELLAHYRARHEIYVVERKWENLANPDGLERDQFDNDKAIYVLAIEGERVVGGSRLIPTMEPHLLSEVFPHLVSVRGLIRAHEIHEWTRMFVIKERREGRNMGRTAGMVICGLLEHCLDIGLTGLTALVEMWWLPRFHDMGWKLSPLGLPELISGEWSVAVKMEIDRRTLDSTRKYHQIGSSPLVVNRDATARVFVA
jgi:acyl-homoserine lactone synthase